MQYYQIKTFSDIDYYKILIDYRKLFATKTAYITTNYKLLQNFQVYFDETYLPHLMGWQKVLKKHSYATHIIKLIDEHIFTLNSTRRNPNFFKIKDRLLNYNFIHEIFYLKRQDICVITRDMKPNPLHLDIVFFKESDPGHIVVLGLRREADLKYFVPTTLHVEKSRQNPYLFRRKTSINSISWV